MTKTIKKTTKPIKKFNPLAMSLFFTSVLALVTWMTLAIMKNFPESLAKSTTDYPMVAYATYLPLIILSFCVGITLSWVLMKTVREVHSTALGVLIGMILSPLAIMIVWSYTFNL